MKLLRRVVLINISLASVLLAGCYYETEVTMRPEYAYPQNLASLCDGEQHLRVVNQGPAVTDARFTQVSDLLLSALLVPAPPDVQRQIVEVDLEWQSDGEVSLTLRDIQDRRFSYQLPRDYSQCHPDGELTVTLPASPLYVWASYGARSRELGLWRNDQGDLIVHYRLRETQSGLIGGEYNSDAWAVYRKSEREPVLAPAENLLAWLEGRQVNSSCQMLTGDYQPEAQLVHLTGSLDKRSAREHFFRQELIGEQPVNTSEFTAIGLNIIHTSETGITLNLLDEQGIVGSRVLASDSLSCQGGKWHYKGDKKAHSAVLLIVASGGMYWEDMVLWRDEQGALLVDSTYKSRGALMLVPVGETQQIFMVFPPMRND